MNRKRLVVSLTNQIFIYDVSCMKLLHTIDSLGEDSTIIADLSASDSSILAYYEIPNDLTNANKSIISEFHHENSPFGTVNRTGTVVLFDAFNIVSLNSFECHKSPLQRLTLSKDGTLLATASIKGTIVRVFLVETGRKIYEFRRGSYSAEISCLSFNSDNTMLACSSNTGTVHLFKLDNSSPSQSVHRTVSSKSPPPSFPSLPEGTIMTDEENLEINRLISNKFGQQQQNSANNSTAHRLFNRGKKSTKSLSKFLWSQSKNYLPTQINSILEPKRDFAYIKLNSDVASVVAIVGSNCYIATYTGDFFIYKIPSVFKLSPASNDVKTNYKSPSGECVLLKQYRLLIP
ncbi:hypothetical protein FOA43_001761 [Brettanomyces nanus]|uniref:Autophagy-related protein 18 n=1 Tax=Eeniella nana TaxID=13502 RepID=A0A875S2Z9_EENNA|nr:uncharacterized protein FOA43_001761 [Brettanomyces nanus]QPG74432.1 hypothetical protein FOA43_001761 [Brettanomyces nanus]